MGTIRGALGGHRLLLAPFRFKSSCGSDHSGNLRARILSSAWYMARDRVHMKMMSLWCCIGTKKCRWPVPEKGPCASTGDLPSAEYVAYPISQPVYRGSRPSMPRRLCMFHTPLPPLWTLASSLDRSQDWQQPLNSPGKDSSWVAVAPLKRTLAGSKPRTCTVRPPLSLLILYRH